MPSERRIYESDLVGQTKLLSRLEKVQKNPRAHKNKIGTPPPPKPKRMSLFSRRLGGETQWGLFCHRLSLSLPVASLGLFFTG